MEPLFLVFIGAALFSQSWHVLGVYAEGRASGVIVGGLGLLALLALTFAPMLLTGEGRGTVGAADHLAELSIMRMLVIAWTLYAVAVAANSLWDLEDRAIGMYSAFLTVATVVSFVYYAVALEPRYSNGTWLGLSGALLALSVIAGIMFFTFGFAFHVLRLVAGWFLLLGGSTVGIIGLAMVTRLLR